MSSESENEERDNFFELQIFFCNECTQLLRSILKSYFVDYTEFLNQMEDFYGSISEKDQDLIKKENANFKKFKLELLCIIFESGVCNESNLTTTGEDILQILQIWRQYIVNNDDEVISESDYENIKRILYEVAGNLSNTFPSFGERFLKKIGKAGILFISIFYISKSF